MDTTFFGGMCYIEGDFFQMPPMIFSAGNIIKISGYTNAECCQWIALIEEVKRKKMFEPEKFIQKHAFHR